jgi:hypothetical protein
MKKLKESLLPEPPESDPNRQKLTVYLFGTPSKLEIVISKQHRIQDVIKHIMTVYIMAPTFAQVPLEFPDNTDAYELRLLEDDEEEYYTPLYEIAALDRKKKIGEFAVDAIAFCLVKTYKERQLLTAPEPSTSLLHA